MKTLITTTLILLSLSGHAQLLYSWTPGVNPAWAPQPAGTSNTFSWQPTTGDVSSSGFNAGTGSWYQYNHNQVTRYTSPDMVLSCVNSTVAQITLSLNINLENRYDFLYFQYSPDGGVTWINPVANGPTSLNGINLSAYQIPNTAAGNRKGWTGALGAITLNYIIPVGTFRFRFIFVTDGSGNTYTAPGGSYIHYADVLGFAINCLVVLPVTVTSFEGKAGNILSWQVESEQCAQYFVERSTDGVNWTLAGEVGCGSTSYTITDNDYPAAINYYRLSWLDQDGRTGANEELVSIDNRGVDRVVIDVVNTLGQACAIDAAGMVIIRYSDGSIEKRYN